MNVSYACCQCHHTNRQELDESTSVLRCAHCGYEQGVPPGAIEQGRLRRKLVVLKIEAWLARELSAIIGLPERSGGSLYQIDMSSKNPRFVRKIWSNDQLPDLHDDVN